MPNCFSLTRRGHASPAFLQQVDRDLCQNLDLPYSDHTYTYGWYDVIGFSLACGKTLPELIDCFRVNREKGRPYRVHVEAMYRIACYLNEHYTSDAWVKIGWQ